MKKTAVILLLVLLVVGCGKSEQVQKQSSGETEQSDKPASDAGLVHLKGLTNLKMLLLSPNIINDVGVADLQKALPNGVIEH